MRAYELDCRGWGSDGMHIIMWTPLSEVRVRRTYLQNRSRYETNKAFVGRLNWDLRIVAL
jgi:hypothetical protein